MPASTTDYGKIKQYQEQAASLTTQGAGIEASAGTLGDTVMKAVRDARTARGVSKLATDVGNVAGQMVTDPTGIRERTSGMVDPFSVNALTSNARAQNLRTLGTISTQQTANQTPIDEVIQSGANKLKAQAETLYAKAKEAEAQSTALQNEWDRNMEERKQQWAEYEGQQKLDIANKEELGADTELLQYASDVLSGGDIKNISMKDNLRGRVQSLIGSLVSNPDKASQLLGFDPLSSVDQLASEAVTKLGNIQDVQSYLNKVGGTGFTGSLQKFLSSKTGYGGAEADTFYQLFSKLGAEQLFSIGGKTLPAQEKGEIASFIPRAEKEPSANVKALDQMYTSLYNESAAEIAKQARDRGISISDTQIKDYLNQQLTSRKGVFGGWEVVRKTP